MKKKNQNHQQQRAEKWLRTCSFKCPEELFTALEAATDATGRNRSQIIVEAIRLHFPEILRRWEKERAEAMARIEKFGGIK